MLDHRSRCQANIRATHRVRFDLPSACRGCPAIVPVVRHLDDVGPAIRQPQSSDQCDLKIVGYKREDIWEGAVGVNQWEITNRGPIT